LTKGIRSDKLLTLLLINRPFGPPSLFRDRGLSGRFYFGKKTGMMMGMKKTIQELLERVLEGMGIEDSAAPMVSVPENPIHGDYSTNVAMLLSRQLKQSPVKFAEKLKSAIIKDQTISDAGIIKRVDVVSPGFLNIYLTEASLINRVNEVLKIKDAYGSGKNLFRQGHGGRVEAKNRR
jgi:hypothetical protein